MYEIYYLSLSKQLIVLAVVNEWVKAAWSKWCYIPWWTEQNVQHTHYMVKGLLSLLSFAPCSSPPDLHFQPVSPTELNFCTAMFHPKLMLQHYSWLFLIPPDMYSWCCMCNVVLFHSHALLARCLILSNWKSDRPPSFCRWICEVMHFLQIEQIRYTLRGSTVNFDVDGSLSSLTWNV